MTLRLRTGYSFRTAVGALNECISRVQECAWPVAPIADRASTFGWSRWEKACKGASLRPVFGVELAVTASLNAKKPTVDYWTFFAQESVEPINRLIGIATAQFRYQPLLTYADAMQAQGVLKMIGHRALWDEFTVGPDMVYGLSPATARGHLRRAREAGCTIVATCDNAFPREQDAGFYEVVCGRNASRQTYAQHITTDAEWLSAVEHLAPRVELEAALDHRNGAWSRCTATLERAQLIQPPRPATLRELCLAGAQRLACDLTDPTYAARFERELALIAEKGFEDYFYLVADLCTWARGHMFVGPARGSSCGSLVCYLLGITTVDPIPHGLIFERFIDVNRADLPDIDIDFSDQNRHLLFEYLQAKYGADRVARLGTVAMYKSRSALQEAGAALKVPRWKCDALADVLIERSSGDARVNDTLEDSFNTLPPGQAIIEEWPEMRVACRMEGHPRHYSQHAAGVVVAAEPIVKYVATDTRTGAVMCDKYDAESRYGLLKVDALGLTQLSVFEDALALAGLPRDHLLTIPTDDQAAFDVLNRKEYSGIFQWNGTALQSLTSQVYVDRFEDLVAISALARPGPFATGGAVQWAKRRMGAGWEDEHPLIAEQTKDTYGVVIYQETVMNICRSVGQFSWADTAAIRKLMSSRAGNERFRDFESQFIAGAERQGMPAETAKFVWDQINTFGSWAFNKSHAVAYAYISYWCCWLKAHHPFEFAAATLTHETDPQRQIQLLREMAAEGYAYVPVDAALSTDKWTVGMRDGKRVLVGPLTNVKGIGPALLSQILGARARGEPTPPKALKLLANPKTEIDSLSPIADAVRRLMPDPAARNIVSAPKAISTLAPSAEPYDALVFAVITKLNPADENEDVNIKKRGYVITDGFDKSIRLRIRDDSGACIAKINRFKYGRLAPPVLAHGKVGKAIWAIKGRVITIDGSLIILSVEHMRLIGDME